LVAKIEHPDVLEKATHKPKMGGLMGHYRAKSGMQNQQNSVTHGTNNVKALPKKRARWDEELSNQASEDNGGVDDLDLRLDANMEEGTSGSEDQDEISTEKRCNYISTPLKRVLVRFAVLKLSYQNADPVHSRRRVRRSSD
jgi:hypothetical protein